MARPIFYTPVKRNHVIAPFGVGAVLLARNGVSVVVCGLDEWLHSRPDHPRGVGHWLDSNRVHDRNLEARLGVRRLVRPPAVAEDPSYHNTWFLRVARFPSWEHCINPKCRRMVQRDPDDVAAGRCATCGGQGRKRGQWPTQQSPLILACGDGHLSDVPWVDWAHIPALRRESDSPQAPDAWEPRVCGQPQLTYRVASDITAPIVACDTCMVEIDLGAQRAQRHECPGHRAWLPGSAGQLCDTAAQLLERTSTNLYFADVRSALHLPLGPSLDHRLTALLQEPVAQLLLRTHCEGSGAVSNVGIEALCEVATARGVNVAAPTMAEHVAALEQPPMEVDDEIRSQELDALLQPTAMTSSPAGLPPLIVEPRNLADYRGPLFDGPGRRFVGVSAVPRLAETRVLAGFSRIEPGRVGPAEGFEMLWGAPLDPAADRDWLPANRVYGEGIVLLLDPDAVVRWVANLRAGTASWREPQEHAGDLLGPRHLLAHTLAHSLLREAAAVCGYSLPSLRERLLVDTDPLGQDRTGLLIYTAEGDSHGTLGGLVELAEPGKLEILIQRAIDHARWCGADPVCMHPPEATGLLITPGCCHHCLLVPETSCELFNGHLDRAALVGLRDGVSGYFA